jgi:hypothetical protein
MFVARRLERSGCAAAPFGSQHAVDGLVPAVVGEGGALAEEAFVYEAEPPGNGTAALV